MRIDNGRFGRIREIEACSRESKQYVACHTVSGDCDGLPRTAAREHKSLTRPLTDLRMQVARADAARTMICLNEVKTPFALPVD